MNGVSAIITWQPPADLSRTFTWYRVSYEIVSDDPGREFYHKDVHARQRNATLTNLVPYTQYRVKIVILLSDMKPLPAFHNFTTDQIGKKLCTKYHGIYHYLLRVEWTQDALENPACYIE